MSEFLSMSGYGIYVWPAYSITLLVFGMNLFKTLYDQQKIKKLISNHPYES